MQISSGQHSQTFHSLATSGSFLHRPVNDSWNMIPSRTDRFFHLSPVTCFFCFSLCFLYTISLKLSEVSLTILFCFQFSSACPIGYFLSIYLITVLRAIPIWHSVVVATFCNSSSSPGSAKPLITRNGCCECYSWSSIFASRRVLTVWVIFQHGNLPLQ